MTASRDAANPGVAGDAAWVTRRPGHLTAPARELSWKPVSPRCLRQEEFGRNPSRADPGKTDTPIFFADAMADTLSPLARMTELARTMKPSEDRPKRPYVRPEVRELGKVERLTLSKILGNTDAFLLQGQGGSLGGNTNLS